jgi:hypothetical protein
MKLTAEQWSALTIIDDAGSDGMPLAPFKLGVIVDLIAAGFVNVQSEAGADGQTVVRVIISLKGKDALSK